MKAAIVNFNKHDRPEFIKEVRRKVNQYFKENNISKHANLNMKIKTVFMLSLYFVPMTLMLTGIVSSFWPVFAMWILMGLGMSGIGLAIMHDAIHRSYSKNQKVNNMLGYLLNLLGGYHINWRIQHNVLHHSYTNIEGFDDDIENEYTRFSPHQKNKAFFKYQMFYSPFLYGIMTLYWFFKDFKTIVRYNDRHLLEPQGLTLKKSQNTIDIQ